MILREFLKNIQGEFNMGMDSTISIDTAHIQSIQVAAKELGDNIKDGSSAVSDSSGEYISSGTDTIKSTVEKVASVVSSLNSYLDRVATAFYSTDASIANSISEGGIVSSYGNPNYVSPDSASMPVTEAEREAAKNLP